MEYQVIRMREVMPVPDVLFKGTLTQCVNHLRHLPHRMIEKEDIRLYRLNHKGELLIYPQ